MNIVNFTPQSAFLGGIIIGFAVIIFFIAMVTDCSLKSRFFESFFEEIALGYNWKSSSRIEEERLFRPLLDTTFKSVLYF